MSSFSWKRKERFVYCTAIYVKLWPPVCLMRGDLFLAHKLLRERTVHIEWGTILGTLPRKKLAIYSFSSYIYIIYLINACFSFFWKGV